MGRLEQILLSIGVIGILTLGHGWVNRVYSEENKEPSWKEVETIQELQPEEYEDKILSYPGAALVLVTATRFVNKKVENEINNMWGVYHSLATEFAHSKIKGLPINFYWVDITNPETNEDENLCIKLNTTKLITIIYGPGEFNSLEEKELGRVYCGPNLKKGDQDQRKNGSIFLLLMWLYGYNLI
ncbi:hypothetical protein HZB88_01090 [archaeon]|nr:hypothetical protein [archaeon]